MNLTILIDFEGKILILLCNHIPKFGTILEFVGIDPIPNQINLAQAQDRPTQFQRLQLVEFAPFE
jgi:hypothetical protein